MADNNPTEVFIAGIPLDSSKTIEKEFASCRESEKKYRTLVENTSDLIALLNPRGRLTFLNRAAQKILALNPTEYFGLSIFHFIHPDDRQRVLTWWRKCRAEKAGDTFIELRQVNAESGRVYNLQWSASFQYDATGRVTGIGVIGRDVSEIRRAEQDYRNLFTKMLDGFALHEIICENDQPVDYRFLSVNPAFESLTGLAAKDLLGKTAREVLPRLEPHWIKIYGKVALTGEPINFVQHSAELGKHFRVAAYCPNPGQFACIFRDITLQKNAEQEKAALEAQLQRRHKMEAIGTLAGGIAHDFNNLLAAILGYAEMALEEIPSQSQASRQIQEVLTAGARAKNLVRQILAFSHHEDQYREPVNLNELITEVVVFLRATIPTTIEILLDIVPNCGNILGDPTQIHQVLMNICTNAGQAMEKDGGILSITLREEAFTDEGLARSVMAGPGTFLCLDIADTGSGIPEKHLERIFDPYFTTKEFGKGSGMGLAVAQGIVKSHDGHIKVVNNPEKGVTFSLYFPRIDAPAKVVETKAQEKATGSERILVVDDEPSIARMLEIILKNSGYTVQTFSSSTKALEIFRADPSAFDLLLTDMTMPELTGDNLALAVHQLRPDIPIILCTGYSSRIDELQAREVGIQAFLMKPVDFKKLTTTVRQLLDNNLRREPQKV